MTCFEQSDGSKFDSRELIKDFAFSWNPATIMEEGWDILGTIKGAKEYNRGIWHLPGVILDQIALGHPPADIGHGTADWQVHEK